MNSNSEKDDIAALVKAAFEKSDSEIDKYAEQKIMLGVMERIAQKAKRRNKVALIVSLCSAVLIFICIVFLLLHFLPAKMLMMQTINFPSIGQLLPQLSDTTPVIEWMLSTHFIPTLALTISVMIAMCWIISCELSNK